MSGLRTWTIAVAILVLAVVVRTTPAADQSDSAEAAPAAAPRGSLVIIGGSERFRDRELWDTIVELAGGEGAKIAIFPTAGGKDPSKSCGQVIKAFTRAGAEPMVVPVAWGEADRSVHEAVADPELVKIVRNASGVYFVGGSQGRIADAMLDEEGRDTPMLAAIRDLYHDGGVIAGVAEHLARGWRGTFSGAGAPPSATL